MGFHAGGARTGDRRDLSGGGGAVRLHRRRVEQLPKRAVGGRRWRRSRRCRRDVGQRFVDRCRSRVPDGPLGRRARRAAGGARVRPASPASSRRAPAIPIASRAQSVSFAALRTTGTDDFNYVEMHQLDRKLTSPHRLAVFDGGHTLPPEDVALEAIEWMELQAMKTGRRPRDATLVDRLFAKREQQIAAAETPGRNGPSPRRLAADFSGLRDVTAEARATGGTGAAAGREEGTLARAVRRGRRGADARWKSSRSKPGCATPIVVCTSMARLRDRLSRLAKAAAAEEDSPQRNQARRVLRAISAGASERVQDPEYRKLLAELAPRGR